MKYYKLTIKDDNEKNFIHVAIVNSKLGADKCKILYRPSDHNDPLHKSSDPPSVDWKFIKENYDVEDIKKSDIKEILFVEAL